MSSNYTGTPGETVLTVPMLDDGDRPSAQLWRQTLEPILDTLADIKAGVHASQVLEDFVGIEIDSTAEVVRGAGGVWSVFRTSGSGSFATTVTRLGAGSSLFPGVLRVQTSGIATDSATIVLGAYADGGTALNSSEPFLAGHFATPGAFVDFRFRLGSNADITFNCGLYSNAVAAATPLAQRVLYIDGGEFRSVSDNGSDPADDHSTGVAVPSFDWFRVRFRTVDALLDTTELYDVDGVLLATVTHPASILDPTTPLHVAATFAQTTGTSKLVDFDLIQAFTPGVER